MKQCNHCHEWKDEEEFNWRYKALGMRHPTCRECMQKFNKAYFQGEAKERHLKQVKDRKHEARQAARDFIYSYLENHPCSHCGERDVRVLDFHHLHGKDMAISFMVNQGLSIERIKEEIGKCIVLCANCHRKVTAEELGWRKGKR